MKAHTLNGIVAVFFLVSAAGASRLQTIELADLPKRADAQVLGRVTQVRQVSPDSDEVTVDVASVLQGAAQTGPLILSLTPRGQRGFGPALKVGDTGVFFLRRDKGKFTLAYAEGVALFPRPLLFKQPPTPPAP